MASAVNVKVEIAFATQPYDPSPTWTDVTTKVAWDQAPIQINRGRSDELTSITASQMSLTLDNKDGRFTAGFASGANFPNVKLGKRIRVSVNPGAGFLEIFDGFVDSWPVYWAPAALMAYAPITASDRLKKLSRQLAADNLISTYYLASSPTDYWMLADAEGTLIPYNRSGSATQLQVGWANYPPETGSSITFGQGTGPGYDGLSAMEMHDWSMSTSASASYTFSETSSLTFSSFLRCGTASATLDALTIWNLQVPLASTFIAIGIVSPGNAYIDLVNSVGTTLLQIGTTNLFDGNTHHVTAVLQGLGVGLGGTALLYIDGVLEFSFAVSTSFLSGGGLVAPLIAFAQSGGAQPGQTAVYTFAHAAIFPGVLTAQNAADFSNAGLNAFQGESTLARTTRIAGLAGVTPVVTGTPGTTSMAPLIDVNGTDYLSLLQTVADTEGGLLFTQRTGEVRLRPRRDVQNQTTKWTIAAGHYLTDLQPLLDDFEIVNDAIGDRPSGNAQHLTNATSVGDNGVYSVSKTLQTTDDNEVLGWAQWQITSPSFGPRFPQVSVDLMTHQSEIATWLTVELGDRITLSGLPSASAPATSVDLLVQGYTETLSKDTYTVQINASPLPPNVWQLNDATFSVLGSTTVLAY